MASEAVTSYPKNVHPLRSRLVFFLRDWSLTLFLAPLWLVDRSPWFVAIVLLTAFADVRLQNIVLLSRRAAETGDPESVERPLAELFAAEILVVLIVAVLIEASAALYAAFTIPTIFLVARGFDVSRHRNIYLSVAALPRNEKQILFPAGGIVGPVSLFFLGESCRVIAIVVIVAGVGDVLLMVAAGIISSAIVIIYWAMSYLILLNDQSRHESRSER